MLEYIQVDTLSLRPSCHCLHAWPYLFAQHLFTIGVCVCVHTHTFFPYPFYLSVAHIPVGNLGNLCFSVAANRQSENYTYIESIS